MLTGIFSVLHVIVSLGLVLVILLQVGRGHGLSTASFGADSAQSVFGARSAEVMQKITTAMAIIFMITCLTLAVMQSRKSKSLVLGKMKAGGAAQSLDASKLQEILKQLEAEQAAAKDKAPAAAESAQKPAEQAVQQAATAVAEK